MLPRPATTLLLIPLLFLALSVSNAALPNALVLNVTQDSATLQYIAQIQQKTPIQTESLVLNITGNFLWLQCDNGTYKSSAYSPVYCPAAVCMEAEWIACGNCFAGPGPPAPGCNNNTCGVFPENNVTRTRTRGDLSQDVAVAYSTDGKNPGPKATSSRFAFSCAPSFLLEGLAKGAAGMAGLAWLHLLSCSLPPPRITNSLFAFQARAAIPLESSSLATGLTSSFPG